MLETDAPDEFAPFGWPGWPGTLSTFIGEMYLKIKYGIV
jgi:hypothetical protein